MLKVLGIDPGSITTGYALVQEGARGHHRAVSFGEISPRPGSSLPERLLCLSEAIEKVMDEHNPAVLAIESVFFAKNARSSLVLGHARAVPLLLAARRGLQVFEYEPRMVKLAVTGTGTATKQQVQKMAGLLLDIDDMPGPDASDALAVAICHLFRAGGRSAPGASTRGLPRTWRAMRTLKTRQ